jgi:outer membrane lipoprotein-sorting protein
MLKFFITLSWIIVFSLHAQLNNREVIDKMIQASQQIKTLKYNMKKWERIDGKMEYGYLMCKLQRNPLKIYIYNYTPNPGAEVLYIEGSQTALVNPNKFPYINLNLDIDGSLLRDKQHHNVITSGFDYMAELLVNAKKKFANDIDKSLKLEGSIHWNKHDCYKVVMENPRYAIQTYTMQPNETVLQVAKKLYVSEYKIIELNKGIVSDALSKAPGKTIKVPSDYGKRIVLYIDKKSFLPIVQFVYDEIGLFEQYEYYDLEINPKFPEKEFTKEFEGYKFK